MSSLRVGPSKSFAEGDRPRVSARATAWGTITRVSSLRVGPSKSFAEGGRRTVREFHRGGPSERFAEGYSLGYDHQGVIVARRTVQEFRRGGPSDSFAEGYSLEFRLPGCHRCASDRPRVSPRGTVREFCPIHFDGN